MNKEIKSFANVLVAALVIAGIVIGFDLLSGMLNAANNTEVFVGYLGIFMLGVVAVKLVIFALRKAIRKIDENY